LANLTTNVGALLVFGVQGEVWWLLGGAMAIANVLGGYLGARLALRLGSGFVRGAFLAAIGAPALRLAVDSVALLTRGECWGGNRPVSDLVALDVTACRARGPSPWRS